MHGYVDSLGARLSKIEMISMDDVIYIHERLVVDAQESDDPISPPGVKDHGLLESAISRQHAGYDGQLKYDDPIANAATLCYGICCNHALHNGNKRTALVSSYICPCFRTKSPAAKMSLPAQSGSTKQKT